MALGLKKMSDALLRIARALERLAPAPMPAPDFSAEAFAWHTGPDRLEPVTRVARVENPVCVGGAGEGDIHLCKGVPRGGAQGRP